MSKIRIPLNTCVNVCVVTLLCTCVLKDRLVSYKAIKKEKKSYRWTSRVLVRESAGFAHKQKHFAKLAGITQTALLITDCPIN